MFIAIVPAYNESKRIVSVIESLVPHVDHIIVVDDASTDDTRMRAETAGATVLSHPVNLGQGAALETGHTYARTLNVDAVLHFDGDGQFNAEDIDEARKLIESGEVDIVLGSRFLGTTSQIPWVKKYVLRPLARLVNRFFSGINLTDAHNGFRVLGPQALEKIRITQNRMAHATEIIEQIHTHGLRYKEIPITVTYHEYGQKMRGGFTIIKDLIMGKFIK